MNVFMLDYDPRLAAQYICDKHCPKMVLETAQLLSWAHERNDEPSPYLYTKGQYNNSCTIWAGATLGNFEWLVEYGLWLSAEYTFRFNKVHKSHHVILQAATPPAKLIEENLPMTFDLRAMGVMPPEVISLPIVEAYRQYYIRHKPEMKYWRKGRSKPEWFNA